MHVPDGFVDAPTSVAAGVVAAAAVAVSLRGARRELTDTAGRTSAGGERTAPLAGLVAAFIFAVQMLNFPVAAGTSGHLLGGALAAVLVGPYTGLLCVCVVLLTQAVLFADGGLTAVGVNMTDMALVTTVVAYGIFRALVKLGPNRRRTVTVASFVAALVSVPAAAVAFTAVYALGGTTDVPIDTVFTAMVGVHVLIGVGEAAITALTVGAVMAVRPDLVYGARHLTPRQLELRTAPPATPARPAVRSAAAVLGDSEAGAVPAAGTPGDPDADPAAADVTLAGAADDAPPRAAGSWPDAVPPVGASAGADAAGAGAIRRSSRRVWAAGLGVALLCAGVVSFYASASPDGLEKVAHDKGIDKKTEDHAARDSPLAGYGVKNLSDARLSGGLAGVIGVGATLAAGSGVFVLVRRRRTASDAFLAPSAACAQHDERV